MNKKSKQPCYFCHLYAWAGHVYTKKEFSAVNEKLYYYGINNNITGETQHIIKYVGSGVSYRTYD
jgi:hypothetical protein